MILTNIKSFVDVWSGYDEARLTGERGADAGATERVHTSAEHHNVHHGQSEYSQARIHQRRRRVRARGGGAQSTRHRPAHI